MKRLSTQRIIALVSSLLVVSAVLYAFFLLGSPSDQRAIAFDETRVQDVAQLSSSVEAYHQETGALPDSLADLKGLRFAVFQLSDPRTGEAYEYRKVSALSYEVCAVFETDSSKQPKLRQNPFFFEPSEHGVGRTCFVRDVVE